MLFYREIGIGLEEMRDLMADPTFDRRDALISQRDLLVRQTHRLDDMIALIDEGEAPGDARAMDAAEHHRLLIDEWFYPCSHEMHAQLGQMYVADQRFAATYEKIHPGMAQYMCDAIAANAARATGKPR